MLGQRFPGSNIHPDVLSQAGRTAGVKGSASGLVAHVFEVLRLTQQARGS